MKLNYLFAVIGLFVLLGAQAAFAESVLQIDSATTPSMISPGNDGYIEIMISNTGLSTVNSITLSLANLDSPLKAVTGSYVDSLGSLESGKSKSVIFRFSVPSNTSSGYYTAQFSIRHCDGSVCKESVEYALITVQSPTRIGIESVKPEELGIGENTPIIIKVKNTGDSAINSAFISWESSNSKILPYASDNEYYLPTISGGATVDVPFDIFVDKATEAGVYPIQLSIEYNDASGTKMSTITSIGLKISGYADFIVKESQSDNLLYGNKGNAVISITNVGSASAEFVAVKGKSSYGEDIAYIGALDSDDEDTAEIAQDLRGATQPYDMAVNITYKDSFGKEKFYESTVKITPSSAPMGITNIIILVVILGAGYWAWKKYIKKK